MSDIDRILQALKRSYLFQVNCELTEVHSKMLLDLIGGLRARIAELESERRWMPVSERLPEDGQEALICYDGNIYLTTYEAQTAYLDDHNNSVICRGFRVEANDFLFAEGRDFPSHWMPKPKPAASEVTE